MSSSGRPTDKDATVAVVTGRFGRQEKKTTTTTTMTPAGRTTDGKDGY